MLYIDKYIGIPYVGKGFALDGCDCWGLVYLIYKNEKSIELPTYQSWYLDVDNLAVLDYTIGSNKTSIYEQVTTPMEGDIVLFNIKGYTTHCGVVLNKHTFIHNFFGTNSCIEDLNNPKWNRRIEGFYRYVGNRK